MQTPGARFQHWWVPRGTAAFTPPSSPLNLVDFNRGSLTLALLALITAGRDGENIYQPSNNTGSLTDGSLDIGTTFTVNRIRERTGGSRITLHGTGTDAFMDVLGTDPVVHIQTDDGLSTFTFNSAGGGFADFRNGTDDNIADDIVSGDRFIIAISYTP